MTFSASMIGIAISSSGVPASEGSATVGGERGSSSSNKEGSSFESALTLPASTIASQCGSPQPQLKGPHQSVGVLKLNSRGHAKAWESLTPTQGATQTLKGWQRSFLFFGVGCVHGFFWMEGA